MRYSEKYYEYLLKKYGKEAINKFERLFSELDPEKIALEVDELHRQAFQQHEITTEIGTLKDFYQHLGLFYQNQCRLIGKYAPGSIDECIEQAKQYLGNNAYSAYKNAKENREDGFFGVCAKIMEAFLAESRMAFIKVIIRKHISMFSYPEKAMFSEYMAETRMREYSKDKKKAVVINISQDIDFWAQQYVEILQKQMYG